MKVANFFVVVVVAAAAAAESSPIVAVAVVALMTVAVVIVPSAEGSASTLTAPALLVFDVEALLLALFESHGADVRGFFSGCEGGSVGQWRLRRAS